MSHLARTGTSVKRIHDMDRVRLERALPHRVRYRYVQPHIEAAEDGVGWLVMSPCCSRNIDPEGGVIAIAWFEPSEGGWSLYHRDHQQDRWVLHEQAPHIQPLLDELCVDPQRVFWP